MLSLAEAQQHPHNRARATHVTTESGLLRPAPAPRFSQTPGQLSQQGVEDSRTTLAAFGIDDNEATALANDGVIGQ